MSEQAKEKKIICITAGATGGHLFPALRTAEILLTHIVIDEVVLFVPERARQFLGGVNDRIRVVYCADIKFSLGFFKFLCDFLKLVSVAFCFLWQEKKIISVLSFGSVIGIPFILGARFKGIPVVIHEQNVKWGRANACLSLFADKVAVSFPSDDNGFLSKKVIFSGLPLRKELDEAAKNRVKAYNSKSNVNILVLGGSQGSKSVNDLFINALENIIGSITKKISIFHIAGINYNIEKLNSFYSTIGIDYKVTAFKENMAEAYLNADFVVSRAGSGTLNEITAFGLGGILIPYPYAARHQYDNARFFLDAEASLMFDELKNSVEDLSGFLLKFIEDEDFRKGFSLCSAKLYKRNAGEEIVKIVLNLI